MNVHLPHRTAASLRALLFLALFCLRIPSVAAPAPAADDEAFLDSVQQAAFGYFWHECGTNGLLQDRMTDKKLSSTMAGGFQLTVICIGAERGWIERDQAAERTLRVLETYVALPRFHGMFAHYYDIETAQVVPLMHERDDGADVSETGFLMAGVLTARAYFDRRDPVEQRIRNLATRLYEEVEWDWMLQDAEGKRHKTLSWHWSPQHGFAIGQRVESTMELSSLITYLLAIGSPTHPIPADCWNEGWAAAYPRWEEGEHEFIACPPLFAHQYAHLWIDFRNLRDRHADYFRNSIRATLANRQYGLDSLYPEQNLWGFTYCDGPSGYGIYGYPPKRGQIDEDAVIAVTAPAGSIPFTPTESISTLRTIYTRFGERMWGTYGFYDAFSPKHDWFFENYVAIDQGPIVAMIENYRSGLVWKYFMQNACIRDALAKVGFVTVLDDFELAPDMRPYNLWESSPHYSHRLTGEDARIGERALRVDFDKGGDPWAGLAARPAQVDFTHNRYLSLWLSGLERLRVRLEDSARQTADLPETGRIRFGDGWSHVYYELPKPADLDLARVSRVLLIAEPGEAASHGTFLLDDVCLAPQLDLEKPAAVTGLRARATRMPGDVILSWDASGDNGLEGQPFRYLVRYSGRPIRDDATFQSALPVPADPQAVIHGSASNLFITGLAPGETFSFAVRAEDLAHNVSDLLGDTTLTLARAKRPPVFVLDDFDAGEAPVLWKSSSPRVRVERTEDFALKGSGSLKITYAKQGDADAWAHITADLDFRDLSDYRYLTLWVYGKARVLAKLWNNDDRQEDISTQSSSLSDGWSPLYFDLSGLEKIDKTAVARLLLFVEPGQTDVGGTIHIDMIELSTQRR
ncbi:MAG: glucoamylase family protein [Planctomycetota bacterium]